jgi:hypothetical protein
VCEHRRLPSDPASVKLLSIKPTMKTRSTSRSISLALLATLLVGCASPTERYLARRPDIAPTIRAAIVQKRVVLGMFPDEANAAAGEFVYLVRADKKRWGDNAFPPQVIFSQRTHPDESHIEMTFRTATQFNTAEPVPFTVTFRRGKAVSITRPSR